MSIVEPIRTARPVQTVRDVATVARRTHVSMLAAGLAYFTFATLLPFALLVVIAITAAGGEPLAERTLEVATSGLGAEHAGTVTGAIFAEEARLPSTLIGIGVFLWSSGRLFGSFDRAFAVIYGAYRERTLAETAADAMVVTATTVMALVLLGVFAALYVLRAGGFSIAAPVVLFAALLVLFTPLFYVFPDVEVGALEILPGTILAGGGWAVASLILGSYARVAGGEAYGVAGLVLLILTWLYLGGLAVLVGATTNAVLGGHVDPGEPRLRRVHP